VLFIIGAFFHFLFVLSGKLSIIGAISAVNESVWEHEKMILLPVICWWAIYYALKGNKYGIDINKWFTGLVISLFSSLLTIPFLFYFYTQAFGVEILAVDIFLLLLADFIGQWLGLHFYKHAKSLKVHISIMLVILIVIAFVVFTFNTPHLPLFQDGVAGGYGI